MQLSVAVKRNGNRSTQSPLSLVCIISMCPIVLYFSMKLFSIHMWLVDGGGGVIFVIVQLHAQYTSFAGQIDRGYLASRHFPSGHSRKENIITTKSKLRRIALFSNGKTVTHVKSNRNLSAEMKLNGLHRAPAERRTDLFLTIRWLFGVKDLMNTAMSESHNFKEKRPNKCSAHEMWRELNSSILYAPLRH